jgi:CPA2 family monovalent cation:H+ antiporter-2
VLVLALGLAIASAQLFGVSMALGAFLAGAVVGQSEFSARAASDALPMRDAFAVLFFVAMGMLLDPSQLVANLPLTAGALAVILVVTPLCTFGIARLTGAPAATARTLAVSLAQIGEFSFVLAAMGRQVGLLPERATQALVAASIVSITLNPLLFRWLAPDAGPAASARAPERHRALVVGYGPVGRTLATLLRESGIEPTVIEQNPATVEHLLREGASAVLGDASDPAVLRRAGVDTATGLVFTASGAPEPVLRAARELNPKLLVLARTTYLKQQAAVEQAGASEAVSAEGAVALAMVERVLQRLGATADQLDRARERARRELGRGEA